MTGSSRRKLLLGVTSFGGSGSRNTDRPIDTDRNVVAAVQAPPLLTNALKRPSVRILEQPPIKSGESRTSITMLADKPEGSLSEANILSGKDDDGLFSAANKLAHQDGRSQVSGATGVSALTGFQNAVRASLSREDGLVRWLKLSLIAVCLLTIASGVVTTTIAAKSIADNLAYSNTFGQDMERGMLNLVSDTISHVNVGFTRTMGFRSSCSDALVCGVSGISHLDTNCGECCSGVLHANGFYEGTGGAARSFGRIPCNQQRSHGFSPERWLIRGGTLTILVSICILPFIFACFVRTCCLFSCLGTHNCLQTFGTLLEALSLHGTNTTPISSSSSPQQVSWCASSQATRFVVCPFHTFRFNVLSQ